MSRKALQAEGPETAGLFRSETLIRLKLPGRGPGVEVRGWGPGGGHGSDHTGPGMPGLDLTCWRRVCAEEC